MLKKIEQLVDINPLIEAARSSKVQLLTAQTIDELLSFASPLINHDLRHLKVRVKNLPGHSTNSWLESPIGRVLAPVSNRDIATKILDLMDCLTISRRFPVG